MLDHSTLTTALAAALPASKQAQAPALADAIIAVLGDSASTRQLTVDASLAAALAGTQITTGGAVLTFGQDNDMRNATITVGDVAGGGIVKDNTITIAINVAAPIATPISLDHNRAAMLALVRSTWIDGVLKQSLWNDALLTLRLTERPNAVARPYGLQLQGRGGNERLPAGTTIEDVYDAQQGALLILGQPGSGKTTLLLELARTLLDRAAVDPLHPIPVVFNLATWQEKQTLPLWFVEQLNREYHIPKKISQAWVDTGVLLPLLDGLDEVAEVRRASCVEAINIYRSKHEVAWATPIVVSCRAREYEALPLLQFHDAILVQPLTREEIDSYLHEGGRALDGVENVVRQDATLYELLETPLMLSVTTLAFAGQAVIGLQQAMSHETRLQTIFTAYVERQLQQPPEGRGVDARYGHERTLRWLTWLGKQMHKHDQSVYFIEFMQPNWLPSYRTVTLLIWGGIGAFLGGFAGFLISNKLEGLLISASVGALISALIISARDISSNIKPIDSINWSWRNIFKRDRSYSCIISGALIMAISCFLCNLFGLLVASPDEVGQTTRNVVVFLIIAVTIVSFRGLTSYTIEQRIRPNAGIYWSIKNSLIVSAATFLISAPLFGVISFLFESPMSGLEWGLLGGLSFGLISCLYYGIIAVVRHYNLRFLLWLTGTFPWNITAFLDSCAQRRLVQRVGGGWRFPHNLIRDYFAELDLDEEKS